jgi:uncharacterized repeat protein (TIGR03803 family)
MIDVRPGSVTLPKQRPTRRCQPQWSPPFRTNRERMGHPRFILVPKGGPPALRLLGRRRTARTASPGCEWGLYGTTHEGGDIGPSCLGGCGTIFKITSGGTFTTVHKFFDTDGGSLQSGLALASNGSLYGGNPLEGCCGDIFELTLPRTITTVYTFTTSYGPGGNSAVLQATNGLFYGTYASPGVAFSLDVGLQPFVAFVIPSGKTGDTAQILGQGLTGATSVTFDGVPATSFSVVSDTFMTAVVPSGATSGSVVVVTPSGTLMSNVSFNITK